MDVQTVAPTGTDDDIASIDPPTHNPLHALLWRKLLAARVLLLCVGNLAWAAAYLYWADSLGWLNHHARDWRILVATLPPMLPVGLLIMVIKPSLDDLAVHFCQDGYIKRFLLLRHDGKDYFYPSPESLAEEYEKKSYTAALAPYIILAALAGLALFVCFAGFIVYSVVTFPGSLATWPPWAVVIVVLLIVDLNKPR